jgi:autotransporter-associated beta strand protein
MSLLSSAALATLMIGGTATAQSAPPAAAQDTPTSIPLDILPQDSTYQDDDGNTIAYSETRLGINVGVNGAQPKEYLFDTGSDSFNIYVGTQKNGAGPAWFPVLPTGKASGYLYGDGTYGTWQVNTNLDSLQFYNSATDAQVSSYATPGGMPASAVLDWIETASRFRADGHIRGPVIAQGGLGKYYQDLTWQQNLDNGIPPQEGLFYGIFGAGDFGNSVTGNLTNTGYIVEANGGKAAPGNCGQACLVMGLTPALRAQFVSSSPWIDGGDGTFKLTGANAAEQFDAIFNFSLNGGQYTAALATLFDSGTTTIFLNDSGLLETSSNEAKIDTGNCAGTADNYCDAFPGSILTSTGTSSGSQSVSVTTGDDTRGDQSSVVTVGPNPYTDEGQALYGVNFFLNNAVMYDLANKLTAFTPFFIVADPITTNLTVTADMGRLGLAGTISGIGPLEIATGGVAQLSGTNTYTGATIIDQGGWLGLAGPGSIASSSGVDVEGGFDLSRAGGAAIIQTLSGAGKVSLGGNMLVLANANDVFSGEIADGGFGGGSGGSLAISAGRETLTGNNTFTGETMIAPGAVLQLDGSLVGTVLNDGLLIGKGSTGALVVTGAVAPGQLGSVGVLTVNGNLGLTSGSVYVADMAGVGRADKIVVAANSVTGSSGIAFIGGSVQVTPVDGYVPHYGDHATILTTQGGVQGTFNSSNALSAILYSSFSYAPDSVDVVVAARPYASVVSSRSPVQMAYASLLDGDRASSYGVLSALYNILDTQNQASTIRSTLERLAPRTETLRTAIGTVALDNISRLYADRVSKIGTEAAGGTIAMIGQPLNVMVNGSLGTQNAASVSASMGSPQAVISPIRLPEDMSAFIAGGYLKGNSAPMLTALPRGGRDDFDGYYVAAGIEKSIDASSAIGLGFSYTDFKGTTINGQRVDGKLYQGTLYGKVNLSNGVAVDAQLSAGIFATSSRRSVSVAGTPFALNSKDSSLAFNSEVGIRKDIAIGSFTITPRVAFRGGSIDFSTFTENGGGPALTVRRQTLSSAQGRFGVELNGSNVVQPFIKANFVHDFLDAPAAFGANFVGGLGPNALFALAGRDKDWGEVGGGLSVNAGQVRLSVSADTTINRSDVSNQSYRGTITFTF